MVFTPGLERTMAVRVQSSGVGDLDRGLGSIIERLGTMRGAVALAGGALAAFSVGGLAAATSAAASFEEAMVEVQKVTDETTAEELAPSIRELATEIPIAQEELAALTADAARFGVRGTENILQFVESTARMATATNLSTQEAGEAFARLATLTNTPVSEIENLGSAVNTLSNNMATSSGEIVNSMLRSSAAMSQLGIQQTDIAGITAALNEVSASAERSGTRLRRLAQVLVEPKRQREIAEAMGLTASEFERMVDEDPTGVIREMAAAMAEGGETADALNEVLDTRVRAVLAGLGQNLDGLNDALGTSNDAFEKGTSLQREFDAAVDTFNARLQLTQNRLRNAAIETGEVLLPVLTELLGAVNVGIRAFNDLNEATDGAAGALLGIGGAAAGAGIALQALGIASAGPVALAIAGISALGFAWANNFADIRSITERSVNDMAGSFGRLVGMLGLTEGKTNDQRDAWANLVSFWETRVATGLDVIATGAASLLDLLVTVARVAAVDMTQPGGIDRMRRMIEGFQERRRERVEGLEERTARRARGLPGFVAEDAPTDQTTESIVERNRRAMEQAMAEMNSEADSGLAEYNQKVEEAMRQSASTIRGAGPGTTGGVNLSADERAALVRTIGEEAVRSRRADDATEVPGSTGAAIRKFDRLANTVQINASGREEGRAAGEAFVDELRSANIVDTSTVAMR